MENLGEKLKQARIAKNLSIEEVHKITKINRNYLAALETSSVEVFPAEVYYKNFLKRYASYLGLNGEQILQEYNDSKKQQENKVVHKRNISKEKNVKNKKDFFIPIIFIILIFVLLLMNYFIKNDASKTEQEIDDLISVNNIYDKQSDKKINDENNDVKENKTLEPDKNTEQEPAKQESTVNQEIQTAPKIQQEVTPAPQLPAQKLVIKAINDTWVDVYADGKRKYTGYIFAGNQTFVRANDVFNIKIGDVTGVDVFFNDVRVDISSGAADNNVNTLELKKENE